MTKSTLVPVLVRRKVGPTLLSIVIRVKHLCFGMDDARMKSSIIASELADLIECARDARSETSGDLLAKIWLTKRLGDYSDFNEQVAELASNTVEDIWAMDVLKNIEVLSIDDRDAPNPVQH